MADVFVSYKRDDRAKVQQLLNGLRSAGVSVWNDEYLEPGERWAERIESEVSSARVVIVAWSRASVESEWVKAEARAARNQGKLIQVFVEPCQPPLFFGDRQGIDLSGWNGSINAPAFRALVDATGAVSRGERPKAGVGYSTGKTRSSFSYLATIFSLFAIVSATGSIANLISLGSATEVVRDIVQSYRALTYPILEYGLGWTGIELSRFARDILLFWLVLGASIARAFYRDVSLSGWSSGARQGSIGAYVISISALVLWPIYLAGIILTPIRATVVRQTAGGVEQSQLLRLDATGLRLIERFAPQVRIKSRQNLLVVLLAQVSVVFIAVLLFLISGVV